MVSLMVFMRLPQESCETLSAQAAPAIREEAEPIRHLLHGSLISDAPLEPGMGGIREDRKSTRLNSSHRCISYAVFCLKKKKREIDKVETGSHESGSTPSRRRGWI